MKIEAVLSEDVFRRFTMFDMFRRRKVWKKPAIWAAILCASGCVCLFMNHIQGAVLLGTVLMIVGLGLPLAYFASFALSVKQQVVASDLRRPRHVYTLELTAKAKGIAVSKEKEHAEFEWKKIHHAYRDLMATYLFITPRRGFILPHDCVEEGEDALWELLQKKLPADRCTDIRK